MARTRPLILVADFFGTVKNRGIDAYVRDLRAAAEPFADTVLLQAPTWVCSLPTVAQNLLLVLHDQIVVPLQAAWRRPDLILYPYNASSFVLALTRRTVCVIHDLIPYRTRTRRSRFAYAYLACTTRWHARFGRRFVAVSPYTGRLLRVLPRFAGSAVTIIPNCFAELGLSPPGASPPRRRVTLISGAGPNKDFAGAIALMAAAAAAPGLADVAFDVVGFGPEHALAEAAIAAARKRGMTLPDVAVHPLLPRPVLDGLIADNAVMWAHSLAEGFGRAVVEGRMAGRPVVMSRLAVFRALRDDFTFSYRNDDPAEFVRALAEALAAAGPPRPYPIVDELRARAQSGLGRLLQR